MQTELFTDHIWNPSAPIPRTTPTVEAVISKDWIAIPLSVVRAEAIRAAAAPSGRAKPQTRRPR